mgnify:CR=1 FL=1
MDELIRKQFEAGKDHPNKPKLVGVTSHGALGEPCDGNGVYTSVIHFSDWISRFVNASDAILVEPSSVTTPSTNTSSNQNISNNNSSRQTGASSASRERPARGSPSKTH